MLTRKSYVMLAEAFRSARIKAHGKDNEDTIITGIDLAIDEVCAVLKLDNVRFDMDVFKQACAIDRRTFR